MEYVFVQTVNIPCVNGFQHAIDIFQSSWEV